MYHFTAIIQEFWIQWTKCCSQVTGSTVKCIMFSLKSSRQIHAITLNYTTTSLLCRLMIHITLVNPKQHKLTVLHQNISSLRHKVTDLEVLLSTELKDVDVLCLTEHWQNAQTISCTNICNFKPVSAFCRMSSKHGGSGIYVKDG